MIPIPLTAFQNPNYQIYLRYFSLCEEYLSIIKRSGKRDFCKKLFPTTDDFPLISKYSPNELGQQNPRVIAKNPFITMRFRVQRVIFQPQIQLVRYLPMSRKINYRNLYKPLLFNTTSELEKTFTPNKNLRKLSAPKESLLPPKKLSIAFVKIFHILRRMPSPAICHDANNKAPHRVASWHRNCRPPRRVGRSCFPWVEGLGLVEG